MIWVCHTLFTINLCVHVFSCLEGVVLLMSFALQDTTFEFEKHRNVPVKYSRELWEKTSEQKKFLHWNGCATASPG